MGTSDHESYCPRCDKVTMWGSLFVNAKFYSCKTCGIRELQLMTDEEAERMAKWQAAHAG
jgi:hypothetical protein